LSLGQQRRLRELGSFLETLNLNDVSAWISGDDQRPLRIRFALLISALGAFDQAVLAAQAIIVQREMASDATNGYRALFSLFDVAQRADLTHWGDIADPNEGRELLLRVLHTGRGSAVVAATALSRVKTQLTMLRFNGLVNRIGGPTDAGELVLV
jgi:hypothetical protein